MTFMGVKALLNYHERCIWGWTDNLKGVQFLGSVDMLVERARVLG